LRTTLLDLFIKGVSEERKKRKNKVLPKEEKGTKGKKKKPRKLKTNLAMLQFCVGLALTKK